MLYPGKRVRYLAKQILEDRNLTFGGVFPNNATALITGIPKITGLTRESVIDGSMYHLIAPFLNDIERTNLMSSMFGEKSRGMRRWFTRGHKQLRYCLPCARRDASQNRPAIWRVGHNHPAANCCSEHECLLTLSGARFDVNTLHNPAQWIDLDVPVPEHASKEEIGVAADLQCGLASKKWTPI